MANKIKAFHDVANAGCGCASCAGIPDRSLIDGDTVIRLPLDASVDGQGGTIRAKPVWDIDQIAFQLNRGDGLITEGGITYRSGAEWFGAQGPADNNYYDLAVSKGDSDGTLQTLTFGFYETLATLPEPYVYRDAGGVLRAGLGVTQGFSAFSAEQRVAARDAIQQWDDLITVKFVETPFQQGDINFMNTTTGPAQASAYLPYDYGVATVRNQQGEFVSYKEISGDVYVAPPSINPSNGLFDEGQYGLTTLVHELGHSLGLEHPGAYNFGPGFDVTYENGAEYYQDSNQYSIMSYWDSEETGANHVDWELMTYRYPSTPMVHDIAAIQRIYGADMTTRTGDTVYGFNSNAGRDSFDFNLTPQPVATIWDAGGKDTIDLSGYATPSILNLNPGSYSSVGGFYSEDVPTLAEINARRAAAGLAPRTQATYDVYLEITRDTYRNGLMTDNLGIAYGAIIENGIGGSGDDLIIANMVANRIDGGGGNDTASWQAATSGVTVNLQNGQTGGQAAGDVLVSIENLRGSSFSDTLTGNGAANVINGGGGRDVLSGGGGVDTLSYAGLGGGVTVDLGSGRTGGAAAGDRISGFENVTGTDYADVLIAGAGVNVVDGGRGDDRLEGGSGDDTLLGGAGADQLFGGSGADILNGGAGADILNGGSGSDRFVFDVADGAVDRIADFQKGDRIDLTAIDANSGSAASDAFRWVGAGAFAAAGDLRGERVNGVYTLFGDVDGDGVADLVIALPGVTTITPADLVLA